MIKSVHEFIKIFSFLFLLGGIFFGTQGMYMLCAINLVTFAAIKILDSDWAFNVFKFSNHNLVVTVVTFGLIFVNVFAIYQEMKYATLFNRVDEQTKESYLVYENSLYAAMKPCAVAHNELVESLNAKQPITKAEIKKSHETCNSVLTVIEKQKIPEMLPQEVTKLCERNRAEIKNVAVDLGSFDYAKKNSQAVKVKEDMSVASATLKKIRLTLQLPADDDSVRSSFVKF